MVREKRKARRRWQQSRSPPDKITLNKITKELSKKIKAFKNRSHSDYLKRLTNEHSTDYSLWKCVKRFSQPAIQYPPIRKTDTTWAKTNLEKANTFSEYLENIFKPYDVSRAAEMESRYLKYHDEIPPIMDSELCDEIKKIKSKKAPGFDLITGEILKQLPPITLIKLTKIMNAIFRLKHIPIYWKTAEVIMVNKPGKPAHDVSSYRPISLLPILSKLLEKLLAKRLNNIIEQRNLIPAHQFGFRPKHSTIDQVHRLTQVIENAFEKKKVCSAVFLDVSKAFDKVCHDGLLNKIRELLPIQYYNILKSYLSDRFFRIKYDDTYSDLKEIKAGVPQGSVLGPILYLVFTSDLPTTLLSCQLEIHKLSQLQIFKNI